MIGAAFSSLGTSTELMFLCAVNCCWNSVSAVGGSQVPGGVPTSLYVPAENFGWSTDMYPWANSVALLSVGSPFITSTLGLVTCQAVAQFTKPWPISWPTLTLLKLT